jgi:hypothetical protein
MVKIPQSNRTDYSAFSPDRKAAQIAGGGCFR